MVLQRDGGHWSRLLPSETFDKSCLRLFSKQSTLSATAVALWFVSPWIEDGCCHRFSLTPLALVVQVVLVWEKLCLVGGST